MAPQPYLIAVAIGPVQDFIAASRKTRDLWFGSMLLSKAARAAAVQLRHEGATLIFPDLPADSADPEAPIPNKLLAILPADKAPAVVAKQVQDAARQVLLGYVKTVQGKLDKPGAPPLVNWQLVHAQIGRFEKDRCLDDRFLEFYAAWVPVDPDDKVSYSTGRTRVEHLLAGRKALRGFDRAPDIWDSFDERPSDPSDRGAAKSSLDPSRETVFQKRGKPVSADNTLDENDRRRLNVKGGEQLDGISLIKRHGEARRFVSVSRVAIDPFIRRLDDAARANLRKLAAPLVGTRAVEVERLDRQSGLAHYNAFPHDTQLFYDPGARDEEVPEDKKQEAQAFYDAARAARPPDVGEFPVHVAVLAADGDHMGKAIGQRETVDEHRELSARLARFATEAHRIVAKYHGALIYSGGDDVLAFLPLDTALCCADELRTRFAEIVNEGKPTDGEDVSLSVGIAIGHYSEHLQNLLDWAREAERVAKRPDEQRPKGRNALAVAMHTRTAGATGTTVTHSWDDDPVTTRWLRWIDWHRRDAIPDGAAYELRDLVQKDLRAMDAALVTDQRFRAMDGANRSLLELEVRRILERKQPRGTKKLREEEIAYLLRCSDNTIHGLERLVDELIVARHFAEVVGVARGAWQKGEVLCR
ncbi:MAG: type III-B CRISPR-associated protein Cas10/Cmr2 [Thermomicrobiales bacterium]